MQSSPPADASAKRPDSTTPSQTNLWTQILTEASRADEKIPKRYLILCGEPHHGKKTLLNNMIGDSDSSLSAFPYPSTSAYQNAQASSSDKRFGKPLPKLTSSGANFLSRNHAAYTANGGSTMILSAIADGGMNLAGNRAQHNDRTDVGHSSRLQDTRNKSAAGMSRNGIRNTGESNQMQDGALPSEEPLRLDILEDPRLKPTEGLVVGYEWIDISEPGENDLVPPLSVFTAPSTDPLILNTLPQAIPEGVLPATGVMIVLDWSKPHTMLEELLKWLTWVEKWSSQSASKEDEIGGYERLKSIIQHYSEPVKLNGIGSGDNTNTEGSTVYNNLSNEVLLPLDEGVLVHNLYGVPIVIVLTRADQIDAVGDQLVSRGLVASKGYSGRQGAGEEDTEEYLESMSWDERVEWIMQTIRTVALRYGASVIHTTIAKPDTFKLLRSYALNLLYQTPPISSEFESPARMINTRLANKLAHRFPFKHTANPLDRDTLLIPVGWDTPEKIKILRESFNPRRIGALWDDEVERKTRPGRRLKAGEVMDEDEKSLLDLWKMVVPDAKRQQNDNKRKNLVVCETEQNFLSRQLEFLMRDPQRDPRKAFRQTLSNHQQSMSTPRPAAALRSVTINEDGTMPNKPIGIVGPVASGGLAMPSVERAFAHMENGNEDLTSDMDAKSEPRTPVPNLTKRSVSSTEPNSSPSSNELLNNFFQGLIAGRRTPGSTPAKTPDSNTKT
ncbi:hypothetical protein QFC22_003774 [Naganishia vaughanmartiniae]|uniref:Uncharacterized protein n=1 Tax=Naganishia vaughanmartiniae TaxID=1424756 RepID=A0ACC2X3D5_9TREE|nr:hypothetical protein QFC22_003774 [Naganishia vaughanmartiniae]